MSRGSGREIRVGLTVLAALAALVALLALTAGGPGFLSSRRSIDVISRDGQGIRVGSPVRVAGLDSGKVVGLDLVEVDGALRAKVRIALPDDLAARLRQDVKITIHASITGQNCVNIVSSGRSGVALVPGQVVQGVETTFFDPILEQVGLGPVERSHLSHTIEEVRKTVDAAGPRARQILASLQETATGLRETSEKVRPMVETTVEHAEVLARHLDAAAPRVEATLKHLEALTASIDALMAENRPNFQATLASVRDLAATLQDMLARDRGKIEALLGGLDETRRRADRVLYQADLLAGQGVELMARNRANIDRTFANVRDTTDVGRQLVEKLYGNPFYLSPFYKPTPEDKRAQVAFDNAQTLVRGVRELADVIKTLEVMEKRPSSPQQQQEVEQLIKSARALRDWLDVTTRQLATDLQSRPARR
jgi:phospholipid/cholesterol/gamma-HCH transport system substrate-binding protein